MLRGAKEKAKSRQGMSSVVLGAMVVGLAAFAGSAGVDLGGQADRGAILATWLVITFGASGISWVTASMLFSMGAQSGHPIVQPITHGNFGGDGDMGTATLEGYRSMPEEKFYRALVMSCVLALRSREDETARIMAGASRSQCALVVGLAVMGVGAVAALASMGM